MGARGYCCSRSPFRVWGVDGSWNHLGTIPSCAIISFFLLGIEELGSQLEEPFGILPMEAFCDGSIGAALNEMVIAEDEAREKERQLKAAAADSKPAAPTKAETSRGGALPDAKGVVVPVGRAARLWNRVSGGRGTERAA